MHSVLNDLNQRIQWSRVLQDKQIGAWVMMEFLTFYGPEGLLGFHKNPLPNHILSQMNPGNPHHDTVFLLLTIIIPSTPGSSK
jgi:hypothetical protein